MYFLINDADNSVNCHSTEPFPDFMVHAGLTRKELPVDHLPADTNLYDLFYDPDTDSVVPFTTIRRMTSEELQQFIDREQEINQAITAADGDKYTQLVEKLTKIFADDPRILEILNDDVVTQDELQKIEDMLKAS